MCAKMHFLFWRHPFQAKLLFFQAIESVKRAFAARAGSGKPTFLYALFLENENKTVEKITGQCFPIKSKVTCKSLAHLEEKTNDLKFHLGYLCRKERSKLIINLLLSFLSSLHSLVRKNLRTTNRTTNRKKWKKRKTEE